ncbi:MAG: hypothetical protein IKM06_01770 [Clostridia bacterium]|jgi:hypothetical protein|nr:hypothetical protein [Clostridia bacterium]
MMEDKIDRALTKMFLKTGDPYYFTARGILRERKRNGGADKNTGDSP